MKSWLERAPKDLKTKDAYGALEDYAGAVKVLNDFDLGMLFMLAGHPNCNLAALHSFGQSFDFGWGQAVDVALEMYIFIYIIASIPALLEDSRYSRLKVFQSLVVYQILLGYGRELGPHKRFWERKLKDGDPFCGKDGKSVGDGNGYFRIMTVDFFEDMAYLMEYLRVCWRLLYRTICW